MKPLVFKRMNLAFSKVHMLVLATFIALIAVTAAPRLQRAIASTQTVQAQQDMYSISLALETYRVDDTSFPRMNNASTSLLPPARVGQPGFDHTLERLTTPIPYLAGVSGFYDSYQGNGGHRLDSSSAPISDPALADFYPRYHYFTRNASEHLQWGDDPTTRPSWYALQSAGPDRLQMYVGTELNTALANDNQFTRAYCLTAVYDPTNGSLSRGSIWRIGGIPEGRGSVFGKVLMDRNFSSVYEWSQF